MSNPNSIRFLNSKRLLLLRIVHWKISWIKPIHKILLFVFFNFCYAICDESQISDFLTKKNQREHSHTSSIWVFCGDSRIFFCKVFWKWKNRLYHKELSLFLKIYFAHCAKQKALAKRGIRANFCFPQKDIKTHFKLGLMETIVKGIESALRFFN